MEGAFPRFDLLCQTAARLLFFLQPAHTITSFLEGAIGPIKTRSEKDVAIMMTYKSKKQGDGRPLAALSASGEPDAANPSG
jgi:hypothetical protein